MISGILNVLSALNAFQKKIEVTANNIANVSTDGFKKSRVEMLESASSGVEAVIEPVAIPGIEIMEDTHQGPRLVEQSNVDLAEEQVNLIVGQRGYEMNLKVLKVQDEVLGTLLDIRD